MNITFLIGRLLFGGFFVVMGLNHFMKLSQLSDWSVKKGLPAAKYLVILSGIALVFSGLTVIFWYYVDWGVWALIIFLILVNLKFHDFWSIKDPQERVAQKVNFMKNIAFIGAALTLLKIYLG